MQDQQIHSPGPLALFEFADLANDRRPTGWSSEGLIQVDLPAGTTLIEESPNFLLALARRGEARATSRFGNRRWEGDLLPGMFAPLMPPNRSGRLTLDAAQQFLIVSFPASSVTSIAGPREGDLGSVHDRGFREPLLRQICLSLWSATDERETRHALFEDCALAALIGGLVRQAGKLGSPKRSARPLNEAEWNRVDSYIRDKIDGNLSLSRLATLTGMPQSSFVRGFKARTGCAPHQYVMRRRVDYARDLLQNCKLSLVEVALQAGFADQAHMTSTFARLTGSTPGRLRQGQST